VQQHDGRSIHSTMVPHGAEGPNRQGDFHGDLVHHGTVRGIRSQSRRPVRITEARSSGDEQFEQRRRKYLIMMTGRAVCIVAAALCLSISGWLSAAFVAGALVLPWTAVLIANDRPPKEALRFRRFVPGLGGPAALAASASRTERHAPTNTTQPDGHDAGPDPRSQAVIRAVIEDPRRDR
jgi:Protein of unknown function (DUF3099)